MVVGQGMAGRGRCMVVGQGRCTELMYVGILRDPAVADGGRGTRSG